jgi:two-component system, chemotaxis family, CheB/CheR fusion protein
MMSKLISEVAEAADPQGATSSPLPMVLLFEKLVEDTRQRELLDVLPAAIYTTDARGRITYYNGAAAALWGCRPRLNSDQWCGSWRMYRPNGTPLPHDQCPMAIALKEGRQIRGAEAIAERPDGTRVPFMAFPTPLRDASGAVIGAVNMLVDLTEHKDAERAARRLISIVESSDDAIVSKDLNGVIATWNKGAERLFGYLAEEIVGKPIMTIIPADRQNEETGILERIRRGERVEHFETVRQHKDGHLVNISLTVSPVRDAAGTITGASKIARDITDQKRREEQIALLAREADHRTKNLLALAQATVHLSEGETPDALKAAIEGRLRALAHAHALLARSRWAGADLRTMVMEELSPYCQDNPQRAQIDGPSLMLEQQSAQAMAVAVHELTTNAVKYGALSTPKGRVSVQWSCDPTQRLTFRWTESGGPPVALPKHQGFGARVMERIIQSQLNGDLKFDWRPEGVVCDIAIDT